MTDTLTFNAQTLLWTLTSTGIINYAHTIPHTGHNTEADPPVYPDGPYDIIPEQVPFDPVHETGGSFWKLTSGPDAGKYVSCWTNSLGYGDVTVVSDYVPPSDPDYPTINPLADWRILIKGMGAGGITDRFPRTVANGWGTSDSGHTWNKIGSSGTLSVDGNGGVLTGYAEARLMGLTNLVQNGQMEVKFDVNIAGTGVTRGFSFYLGPMFFSVEGGTHNDVFLQRFGVDYTSQAAWDTVTHKGFAVTDGLWHVHAVVDVNKSYANIWKDGNSEPGSWLFVVGPNDTPFDLVGGNWGGGWTTDDWTSFDFSGMSSSETITLDNLDITGQPSGGAVKTNTVVTINQTTNRYSRTTAGLISPTPLPRLTIPPGGPYRVNPIVVPYDPIWGTGGSFWRMVDGPYPGWLLSKWTNTLSDDFGPYGNITISNDESFSRAPGPVIATLYHPNAHLADFSINYNAPGECHFTLLVDDPNIGVIIPKQCHATFEFWNSTTSQWDEVWAGVIWDMDATDTEVVFYGIDYLGMLQYCVDERFNPAFPKKAAPTGSWYAGKTIKQIVDAQLDYSIGLPDSWVGWITRGTTDAMSEKIAGLPSTFAQTLPFIVGLIDSHRAGTGKNTRLSVKKVGTGYQFVIEDNPGVNQDGKMIRYGNLAQGYRIVKFGQSWASRVNVIARMVDGVKVEYKSDSSGVDQGEWGRVAQEPMVIETMDKNDLNRRVKQAALDAARMGRQIGIGLKLGSFRPLEDYDICDNLPIEINHGAVATKDWASDVFGDDNPADPSAVTANFWTILGLTFSSYDDGHWITNLTLFPKGGGIVANPPVTASPDGVSNQVNGALDHLTFAVQPLPGSLLTAVVTHTSGTAFDFSGIGWTSCGAPKMVPGGSNYVSMFYRIAEANEPTLVTFTGVDSFHSLMDHYRLTVPNGATLIDYQFNGSAVAGNPHEVTVTPPAGIDALIVTAATYTGNSGTSTTYNCTEMADTGPAWCPGWSAFYEIPLTTGDPVTLGGDQNTAKPYMQIAAVFQIAWDEDITVESPIVVPTPASTGWGPPTAATTSDEYTDLYTGITYVRNDDTETYDVVPGTGSVVDFDFASSTEWVINHTIGGYPRVTLMDSGGAVIEADVVYTSTSVITCTFSSAVAGKAHLG